MAKIRGEVVHINSAGFAGKLPAGVITDVQKLAEEVDTLAYAASEIEIDTSSLNFLSQQPTVQAAFEKLDNNVHIHNDFELLDSLTSTGGGTKYLADDGTYKPIETGGEAVNIETLTADKTLITTDPVIQIYKSTANYNVNLPFSAVPAGHKFVIWNNNAADSIFYFSVKVNGTEIHKMYAQNECAFYYNGSEWIYEQRANIASGEDANAANYGTALGYIANAGNFGVAAGYQATGEDFGVAIGMRTNTNEMQSQTVAIGAYSKNERNREIASASDETSTPKSTLSIQKWKYQVVACDGAWHEIFIDGATHRLNFLANSAYQFYIQLLMKDYNAQLVKAFEIRGVVQIDTNAVPSLAGFPSISVVGASAGTDDWEVRLTADINTKTYLKIEVKGDTTGHNLRVTANSFNTEQRV